MIQSGNEWLCRNCNSLVDSDVKECPTCHAERPEESASEPIPEGLEEVVTRENYTNANPAVESKYIFREAVLVNVGGGMITDLGGFAAATYMRGIRFVNIPTTLLAMVDASSGGKTGFDYRGVKNLVGCFAQPEATLVYLPFLDTLPVDEWLSGYAEMLKHGLLDSREHLDALLAVDVNDAKCAISSDVLSMNMAVKERIIAEDPKEKGVRNHDFR